MDINIFEVICAIGAVVLTYNRALKFQKRSTKYMRENLGDGVALKHLLDSGKSADLQIAFFCGCLFGLCALSFLNDVNP